MLVARKANGAIEAVISSFSTHPDLSKTERYSADLPGQVRRVFHGALGEQVGVVYLTGAAGNTGPSIIENNPQNLQPWRKEEGLVRSGLNLGGEILKVIANQINQISDPVLQHAQAFLEIPMREWDTWADLSEYSGGMREFFEKAAQTGLGAYARKTL